MKNAARHASNQLVSRRPMATSSTKKKISSQSSDYLSIIRDAASSLGYSSLKNEQKRAIEAFIGGKDVFVSLPTGYGKSLCFALLPLVFDMMRGVDKASIAIIISPLISLMQDQVANFNRKGISSVCVSDKETTSKESRRNILKGRYQLIFMSPESLFRNLDWRRMLSTDVYMKNLIAFVVDEAHCVTKW